METDEGTTSRRPRRRAVRPAGPASGAARPPADLETPAPDKTPARSEPDVEAPGGDRAPRRRRVLLPAVFVILMVTLLAFGAYLALGLRATDAEDARGERFVQTARQTVLNLTTIHPDSAQEDVDRLLAGASGDFKAEFEGREGPFVDVVKQARVDSNGEIIEAGIESASDDSADVLVAARAMVQNSDAAEAQPRDFRLRVTVVDSDGVMTASRVEFVP